ncbi:MAG: hypothetical protein ACP5JE_05175, partial [Thermoplasmata archaeon]
PTITFPKFWEGYRKFVWESFEKASQTTTPLGPEWTASSLEGYLQKLLTGDVKIARKSDKLYYRAPLGRVVRIQLVKKS